MECKSKILFRLRAQKEEETRTAHSVVRNRKWEGERVGW